MGIYYSQNTFPPNCLMTDQGFSLLQDIYSDTWHQVSFLWDLLAILGQTCSPVGAGHVMCALSGQLILLIANSNPL